MPTCTRLIANTVILLNGQIAVIRIADCKSKNSMEMEKRANQDKPVRPLNVYVISD